METAVQNDLPFPPAYNTLLYMQILEGDCAYEMFQLLVSRTQDASSRAGWRERENEIMLSYAPDGGGRYKALPGIPNMFRRQGV
jgi:hypothetical protein